MCSSDLPGCGRPSPASDTPSSPRLASVHGRDIRVEDFRLYWDDQRMATNSMPLREQVLEHLIQRSALADPKVQPFIEGKQVVKVIVVPDKLVNIVVK